MQPFLEKLANYIHQYYNDKLGELCIVLPNRRAKVFLKNYISVAFGKPVWAPQIFSVEDFIAELSGAESMDGLTAAFEFYAVYAEIEKDKAQAVDDFLQWAPTLLHDFNEIDQYLVDAKAMFEYLSDERAIRAWNPDGKDLTDFQKKYLLFWRSLADYYQKFASHLQLKNLMYQGLAYRKVADNVIDLAKNKNWHKIIFAGFNALNTAEKKIFKTLAEAGMADIVWDADDYYVNDENQEAGKFIREFKATLGKFNREKSFLWQEDNLVSSPKNIVIAGVAQQISQAKVAGEILRQIALEEKNDFRNHALVLADENLLMPVLHSIPQSVERFNVTMGYSLNNLSLNTLFDIIFSLQENAVKFGKSAAAEKVRFYYRDLKKLMLHPYVEILLGRREENGKEKQNVARSFIHFLEKQNIVFVKLAQIQAYFSENNFPEFEFLKFLLLPWEGNVYKALQCLLTTIETLKFRWNSGTQKIKSFENEILFQYAKIIKRIISLVEATTVESFKEIKTIRAVFNQLVKEQTVAFIGEPLEGLQVMGMLETRTLDFETVILLSANEGVLPSAKKENSFIPFDLKSRFGLPTYSDKDAIFGYHFYRLLQCATTIYLVFNTETDEFGSGERSRYIAQLQHELIKRNRHITITEKLYTIPLNSSSASNKIEIKKNDFVYKKLKVRMESGLSPSLLNSYRNCSLQFYFSYIADLREQEEPVESIDASTFGTAIHAVLEESFTPFVGKKVAADALKKSFGEIKSKVLLAFQNIYKNGELSSGKNLLNLKVAEKYLQTFLKEEIRFIQNLSPSESLTILHLEKELNFRLELDENSVLLKGRADRIDKVGNTIRIIDYKTGAVDENKELRLKEWSDLKEVKRNKGFQLLMYAYLYHKTQNSETEKISSGILSFRELSKGVKQITFGGKAELDEEILNNFETVLKVLVKEMLNPKIHFVQTEDTEICDYCAFKLICNR